MKKITAKFKSRCAETNRPINKGDWMLYDYANKKCYSINSKKAQDREADKEGESLSRLIEAQENAFFDSFCQNNNI